MSALLRRCSTPKGSEVGYKMRRQPFSKLKGGSGAPAAEALKRFAKVPQVPKTGDGGLSRQIMLKELRKGLCQQAFQ